LGERKTNGKLHSVERTPSENPINIKNQWKIPGLGMGISGKFLSMEGFHNEIFRRHYIVEQDLTQARSKKHFPFQEDFGPCTSLLWSGI
jgi:hypothetical protein